MVTYHRGHCSWLLYPQCLNHLEDVHDALCLAGLNGRRDTAEYTRTSHCIAAGRIYTALAIVQNYCSPSQHLQNTLLFCISFLPSPTHLPLSSTPRYNSQPRPLPAMDHNGGVAAPPLYVHDTADAADDGSRGGTQPVWTPVQHLELSHSMHLPRLEREK